MLIDPEETSEGDAAMECYEAYVEGVYLGQFVSMEVIGGPAHGEKWFWPVEKIRDTVSREVDGWRGVYDVKHIEAAHWVATYRDEG